MMHKGWLHQTTLRVTRTAYVKKKQSVTTAAHLSLDFVFIGMTQLTNSRYLRSRIAHFFLPTALAVWTVMRVVQRTPRLAD